MERTFQKKPAKKISESHKGMRHSEETKRKLSEINKGKKKAKEAVEKMRKYMSSDKNPQCKPVRCIETGTIYFSAAEAARQTGLERSKISAVCRGERKTHGSLSWEFV